MAKIQCGSEPARDGGVSGGSDAGCNGLFAGWLAPTGIFGERKTCVRQKSKCGSEPARNGGVSVSIDAGCDGLFAGKPAPTGIFGEHKICVWQKSNVGASLLAMAECQSALMLDVMASSRASPLPQGSAVNARFVYDKNPVWERACSRRRSIRHNKSQRRKLPTN